MVVLLEPNQDIQTAVSWRSKSNTEQYLLGLHKRELNMKKNKGGTIMYCPACGKVTPCKAIHPSNLTGDDFDEPRFFKHYKAPDIYGFSRGRECLECGHKFETVEIEYRFLKELIDLREKLSDIEE